MKCHETPYQTATPPPGEKSPEAKMHGIRSHSIASVVSRGRRTACAMSRRHGLVGPRHRCRYCRSSAGGRCPCGCSGARAGGPGGQSGGRCPICKRGVSMKFAWKGKKEATYDGVYRGAQTMAMLSGIMTWYPAWVCISRELMKQVCVGWVWIHPTTRRSFSMQ